MSKKFSPPRKYVKVSGKYSGSQTPLEIKQQNWDEAEEVLDDVDEDTINEEDEDNFNPEEETEEDLLAWDLVMLNSENIELHRQVRELKREIELLKKGNMEKELRLISEAKNYIPKDKE